MTVYSESQQETGFRGPVPRDARLVALILASMGVADVQPEVLLQLLEFAHRYTYDVLSDALVYADHASGRQASTNVALEDVSLAIQSRVNYSFTKPPEKDMLLALATSLNSVPLPPISDRHGVRLPPPQHCLTNVNFSIVPNPPPSDFHDEEERHVPAPTTASQPDNQVDTNADEDDDYDADDADNDISMTAVAPVEPSTSEPQADDQRGTKRSLDEDEDYD